MRVMLFSTHADDSVSSAPSFVDLPASEAEVSLRSFPCVRRCHKDPQQAARQGEVCLSDPDQLAGDSYAGYGTYYYDSDKLFLQLTASDESFECFVSSIEAVLDEGLKPIQDFSLVRASSRSKPSDDALPFLASSNLNDSDWWISVIELTRQNALKLLASETMGYLLGLRSKDQHLVILRCAGYDDGQMDLFLVRNASPLPNRQRLF